jgi:hypothetical protein
MQKVNCVRILDCGRRKEENSFHLEGAYGIIGLSLLFSAHLTRN